MTKSRETMADKKTPSKTNLNESTLPLLESDTKGGDVEKDEKIELETKVTVEGGDGEGTEEKTEKEGKKKKEKKVKAVKESKPRVSPLTQAKNFTVGLNVLDRDEKSINQQVNIQFDDVLGETDSNQGFELVWRLTYIIFISVKFWAYRLVATVLALPLAIIWALVFAVLNVLTVWGFTPLLRVFDILLHHVHRVWSGLVHTALDPIFTSIGLLFANIRQQQVVASSGSVLPQ